MCEPSHSIVQFPDEDDRGPTGGLIDALPQEGFWERMKKRIGNWFHLSKMGRGHSETLGHLTLPGRRLLPPDTKYEAHWWERTVVLDGRFNGIEFDKAWALECANEYAHQVSIGSMHQLRQYLEVSMRKSYRPSSYLTAFTQMLNAKGRDAFQVKIKHLPFIHQRAFYEDYHIQDGFVDKAIKVMLGFTRKRELLVPEWADDPVAFGVT